MESLATRYADELRTHYKDVLARLEDIRRRRVAIDFPPLPPQSDSLTLKTSRSFKPGKYSPSSCLSDHEEESIYCLYEVPPSIAETPSSVPADPLRSAKPSKLQPSEWIQFLTEIGISVNVSLSLLNKRAPCEEKETPFVVRTNEAEASSTCPITQLAALRRRSPVAVKVPEYCLMRRPEAEEKCTRLYFSLKFKWGFLETIIMYYGKIERCNQFAHYDPGILRCCLFGKKNCDPYFVWLFDQENFL
ncbi:uncharacterized protein TNIN_334771 [Trichonephila inaurata madagascariensis]|uniref:Uncharacterized protein n=1 Tax=Trichonephila inaurata madagascariensis TaxID=2747483 RepID=A0A8X6WX18_9ARAC|nr:uncharacterized protein TNIN_334771 [Trichonephila inaurata madagascariensis]